MFFAARTVLPFQDYITRRLQQENDQISEDDRLIRQYREETERMRNQIDELKTRWSKERTWKIETISYFLFVAVDWTRSFEAVDPLIVWPFVHSLCQSMRREVRSLKNSPKIGAPPKISCIGTFLSNNMCVFFPSARRSSRFLNAVFAVTHWSFHLFTSCANIPTTSSK